jgi:hypothetical protein
LVGDEASNLERLMVESRVVVRNAAGVQGHMRRRSVVFDGPSASFGRPQEAPVPSERESRGVGRVADAVESWLGLCMGDRSHRVVEPIRVRSTR